MKIDLITKDDLSQMKVEILEELRILLDRRLAQNEPVWLRSSQVRKILAISPGTLQNLRVQGLLAFTKVGGTFFYKKKDIEQMLSQK